MIMHYKDVCHAQRALLATCAVPSIGTDAHVVYHAL